VQLRVCVCARVCVCLCVCVCVRVCACFVHVLVYALTALCQTDVRSLNLDNMHVLAVHRMRKEPHRSTGLADSLYQ